MLCEFTSWNIWPSTQQEKLCTGLAYSTQHVANEDVNQFVWGGGVGVWRCWFSIAIEITKTNGRDPRTNHIYCWSHAIPYPVFGVVINIMSKEDNTYYVTIGDITQYMFWASPKCHLELCKKRKWVYCKHIYYVVKFLYKWTLRTSSSFMLQCTHTTRSCVFLSLPAWWHMSSHVS